MKKILLVLAALAAIFILANCKELGKALLQPVPSTKSLMEGVWKVTDVQDTNGVSLLDTITSAASPVAAFQMNYDSYIMSTAGPLALYLVYGKSQYVQIAGFIDQVFDYVSLVRETNPRFTGGNYYLADTVVDRFTYLVALQGLPGQRSLDYVLNMIGIHLPIADQLIYHKFMGIKIEFKDENKTMVWTFDNSTTAKYYTVDAQGEQQPFMSISPTGFSRCTITLAKQTLDLKGVVQAAVAAGAPKSVK